MRYLPYVLALASLQPACALLPQSTQTAAKSEAPALVQAAQTFAHAVEASEAPAVTTAVAHLPVETQALAQAAYQALQRGIDAALVQGVADLSTQDQARAQAALVSLGKVVDKLSDTLHAPGDPVLAPLPAEPSLVLPHTQTIAP